MLQALKSKNYKAKDSEIDGILFCLDIISNDFSVDNMKKTGLHRHFYGFLIDSVDVDDILDVHRYLMIENSIK